MILLGADAEAQHHHIQERRLGQLDATGTVVIAGMELNLIDAATVVIPLLQRCIASAVAVGQRAGEQLQLRTFDAVQLDLDRAARAAVRGIQNVSSQTSH